VAALRRCNFTPAVVAGAPVTAVREMRFRFSRAGVAIENLTGIDVLSRALERATFDHMSFRALALRELDRIPTPVTVIKPRMPEALATSRASGTVTVEFYIDETGNVRMPAALDRTLSDHACEAVEAVRQWKFEVPTAHGKPALALVRQKFHFDPN
jgi:TonB family protein